jgi:O-antigen ligase
MILNGYRFVYLFTLVLIFSISLLYGEFVVFLLLFTLLGISLRVFFKRRYLLVFSALIPILSSFAGFNRSGFPNNYFILPILVLTGIVIADSMIHKELLATGKETISRHYIYFLIILFVSFIFVVLRWSNIFLSRMAFLKNTQVDISGERFSFAIIFPILELGLFVLSVPYYAFCRASSNKNNLMIAFVSGQCVSVLFALGQFLFNKPLTTVDTMSTGFASDPTTFGMLCAISLIMVMYLGKNKFFTITFVSIFLFGIAISATRVALMALLILPFFGFRKIKKNAVWISGTLAFMVLVFVFVGKTKTGQMNSVNEIKQSIAETKNLAKGLQERNTAINSILSGRDIIWDFALTAIKRFPLTGIGPGNFIFWGRNVHGKEYFINITLTANSYLLIAVANGLIGTGLFVLFIVFTLLKKQLLEKAMVLILLAMFVFNDSFWLAEVFLGFWLICSLGEEKKIPRAGLKEKLFVLSLVLLFILVNIFNNSALLPHNWSKTAGVKYDYGFWYDEKYPDGRKFQWTGAKAGVYIYLDRNGRSATYDLVCGAPLSRLPGQKQTVDIFWRGRFLKSAVFSENGRHLLQIEDHDRPEGFLEFRVRPTFNLKHMGLGPETRDLGIQFSVKGQ